MSNFDPDVRARIVRMLIALFGVVALSVAIGLSVGRPFASSGPAAELVTSAPPTGSAAAPTSPPTPTSPPATLTAVDGWLIRSTETFEHPSNWPAQQQQGWASGYQDGRYFLKLDGQQTISYRVPLDSPEFRISADVRVS